MSSRINEVALSVETKDMRRSEVTGSYDSYRAAPYNKRQSCLPLLAGVHRLSPIPEELGVIQTSRETKSITNAIRMLELTDIVVDITILNTIRRVNPNIAKLVEYDCEFCDDNLLPLTRLEHMMAGLGDRPPIKVARCGSKYKLVDGRHRLTRSWLIGKQDIPAIVMNDGHEAYLLAGGESNPGPETEQMITPKIRTRNNLYSSRYRKSSIPQNQISTNAGENHISISDTSSTGSSDISVCHTRGKRNFRTRKNRKGYRNGNYRKDRIELDIPVVLPKEEFNSDYLAKLISGDLPCREDLELRFMASKLNLVYQCPCGRNNYGFPKGCGCSYKDQVIAMYNNLVARELQVIVEEQPDKVLSDIILEKELVANEIKSVESAIKTAAFNFKTNPEPVVSQNPGQVGASNDVIVRKRRGIYRLLKTPGIFNFDDKFNHHHQSITKSKDQSSNNRLVISDEFVNDELYNYLRRNEFDTYPDRATKLSHMTKLAAKWESNDFKLSNQGKNLCPRDINKYFVTIQKVTDARDTEFLLSEVNAYHSNSRFKRFLGKLGCYPKYLN